jgi:hypothetical protein
VSNDRKYINISAVFVALSVLRFYIWEGLLSGSVTLSCLWHIINLFGCPVQNTCRSQWPRDLRRRSAAASLLRSWVQIPPGGMDVCCGCWVLSGRGLCDELITRPEESCRLWCVVECDLETAWMRRPCPTGGGGCTMKKNNRVYKNAFNSFPINSNQNYIWKLNPYRAANTFFLGYKNQSVNAV